MFCPVFLNFENKKILVVGGGNIAYRKINILLQFTKDITVISKSFSEEFRELIKLHDLNFFEKSYESFMIKDYDFAVIAIDNMDLQNQIWEESKSFKCLCNYSDLPSKCDFTFGAFIKKEDLTISISTNGHAPSISKQLKLWLEKKIPQELLDFLKDIKEERLSVEKGENRMEYLREKSKRFFEKLP